jgi:hypothetical protein
MKLFRASLLGFAMSVTCGMLLAQTPDCPDGNCQVPVEANEVIADTPHVRCIVGNSCGSGTICGRDSTGSYVLSNAHVWGTQLGKVVNIDCVVNGAQKRVQGRLIFAGYSSTRMVDFAIALVPNLKSKRYMPMLKTEPTGQPFATTGGPRCVWPQVTKPFNDPRSYGDGLVTGSPDAIGGQSGSSIYNAQGNQIALLTWSINGRCAGQKTSKLWQVATNRNVLLADPRPDGLRELGEVGELTEGVFGIAPMFTHDEPFVEDGIFGKAAILEVQAGNVRPKTDDVIASMVNASMETMPIWAVPNTPPPPVDPVVPPPPADGDCMKLTEKEKALIEFLRSQETKFGEKAFDWAQIIRLVLELIQLIQAGRS